ncbi:MAG: response regulator transcription factor [Cytophagales bacterium]|nr:response regulator transcription factor [Cytophagales bacterium]
MTSNSQPIRVVLVEDDIYCQARLLAALSAAEDLIVVAVFVEGKPALDWLKKNSLDVLLCDLGLPDVPGLAVISTCAQLHPKADILVVTMYDDQTHIVRALEAGASGYLLKDGMQNEIAAQVRELRDGGAPMTPVIARQVLKRFRPAVTVSNQTILKSRREPQSSELTAKELLILNRIAQGFRYAEIANLEKISVNTVNTHVKRIYSKLAVSSRTEAVFEAQNMGLLDTGISGNKLRQI